MSMDAIDEIRNRMAAEGIDWLILFSADPHLCENVPDFFNERKRLLGFRGSAGTVILTPEKIFFRTDSRYYLECEQLFENRDVVLVKDGEEAPLPQWLGERLTAGETVAVNKSGISHPFYRKLELVCREQKTDLTDFDSGRTQRFCPGAESLDAVVKDPVRAFRKKIGLLRRDMKGDVLLLTAPDTIAWLTGFRLFRDAREDVFFYSWALITSGRMELFTDHPLPQELPNVEIFPYGEFLSRLDSVREQKIECSFNDLNENLFRFLINHRNTVIDDRLRIRLMQTVKTRGEIAAVKKAAAADKRVLLRFRRRLLEAVEAGERFNEADSALLLEELRRKEKSYRGASFETIAAFGENGAVVHYKPAPESSAAVNTDGLLLLDCGTHSINGTTDITRVFWTGGGTPPPQAVRDYTAVLKAHIALARTRFPQGTCGAALDAVARGEARRGGAEYGHGTGHGVGWINCVHEPPFSISPSNETVAALPGMIVSIEPGCYRKGEYGIRIENIYAIVRDETDSDYLRFERLTDFPFESQLTDRSLLTDDEKKWIDENGGFIDPLIPY